MPINKAIEKSVDSEGNLRVSDAGILFLEGIIKPGETLRTDLDFSLAKTLVNRLNAICPNPPAEGAASAQCKQLATLAQPFDAQGGTMMTAYWPGWPKEDVAALPRPKSARSPAFPPRPSRSISAPNASLVPLPAAPPPPERR